MLNAIRRGAPRLRRIDVPDQPMRIAQARGPDLLARALDGDERIVVRECDSGRSRSPCSWRCARAGPGRCAGSCRPGCRAAAGSAGGCRAARRCPSRPTPTYMTRQSGSPRRAVGLNVISPSGWIGDGSCIRSSSRAVPSNVAFAMLRSVHSIITASRVDPSRRAASASRSPASSGSRTGRGRARRRTSAPAGAAIVGSSMWIV